MRGLRPVLIAFVAACVVVFGMSRATADEVVSHPVAPGMTQAACNHCHDNPHEGEDRFADCGACHATDSFRPSTFTVKAHAATAFALEGRHTEVGCRSCHVKAQLLGLPTECAGCHIDRHRGLLGEACTDCHTVQGFGPVDGFAHARTGFALEGPHVGASCESCHQGANGLALRQGKGSACQTCHSAGHGDIGETCETCHPLESGATFAKARRSDFDHRVTGFRLSRRHSAIPCASCHPKGKSLPDARCASCHISPHGGQLGTECTDCHRADRWSLIRFDHDLTGSPLRGAHHVAPCTSCHTNERWIGLSTTCWDCHAQDTARAPMSIEAHRFGRVDCSDCHGTWRWR